MNTDKVEIKREYFENEIDRMRNKEEYNKIDMRFIEAADIIISQNEEMGIKPDNDSSLGKLIYPSNRSIISAVRSRNKHIPHLALINFAKEFNVDMNFFYNPSTDSELNYKPKHFNRVVNKGNSVVNTGNDSTSIHAGEGSIKWINKAEEGSINKFVEADKMIYNFINELDRDKGTQFRDILNKIQSDSQELILKLQAVVQQKVDDIKQMAKEHRSDSIEWQKQLKDAQDKLYEAQKSESDILKKYIESIKS